MMNNSEIKNKASEILNSILSTVQGNLKETETIYKRIDENLTNHTRKATETLKTTNNSYSEKLKQITDDIETSKNKINEVCDKLSSFNIQEKDGYIEVRPKDKTNYWTIFLICLICFLLGAFLTTVTINKRVQERLQGIERVLILNSKTNKPQNNTPR